MRPVTLRAAGFIAGAAALLGLVPTVSTAAPAVAVGETFVHWVGEFEPDADLEHYADWVLEKVGVPADDFEERKPDGYLMGELDMVWLYLTPDEAEDASALIGQAPIVNAQATGIVSLPTPVEGGGPFVAPGQRGVEHIPTGIQRIGTPVDEWERSAPSPGDVKVAVIDTGIAGRHPDLNLVGGFNCSQDLRGPDGFDWDLHGHGTHVAGTIGAKFNDADVVGVAPGVSLLSEVVFSTGSASGAMVLCGVNKALEHGADILSASLGGSSDPTRCGGPDVYINGWCKAAQRAVVVVAAGNDTMDAITKAPSNVDAAALVSVGAVVDFDGETGGLGVGEYGCGNQHRDDYLAVFSNFGETVDVVAPGGCIESDAPPNMLAQMSGTSMATPHVTGVFAAFMTEFPDCDGSEAVRTVISYATKHQSDNEYDGWPGAEAPPLIKYIDEEPLRYQDPEDPRPCAFEEAA